MSSYNTVDESSEQEKKSIPSYGEDPAAARDSADPLFPDRLIAGGRELPPSASCGCNEVDVGFTEIFNEAYRVFRLRPWAYIASLLAAMVVNITFGLVSGLPDRRVGFVMDHMGRCLSVPLWTGIMYAGFQMMRGGAYATNAINKPWFSVFIAPTCQLRLVGVYLVISLPVYIVWLFVNINGDNENAGNVVVEIVGVIALLFLPLTMPVAVDRPHLLATECVQLAVEVACRHLYIILLLPFYWLGLVICGAICCVVGIFPALCVFVLSQSVFYARTFGLYSKPSRHVEDGLALSETAPLTM